MNNGKGTWVEVKVNDEKQDIRVECDPPNDPKRRYILNLDLKPKIQTNNKILVIMLNPSTADEKKTDSTCRALMNLCDWNGYNTITVCNLFSLRTSNVKELNEKIDEANDIQNDDKLKACIGKFDEILCAWGKADKIKRRKEYDARIENIEGMLNGKKLKKIGNGLVNGKYPFHPYFYNFKKNWSKYGSKFENFYA
jgi:hypothetical protein